MSILLAAAEVWEMSLPVWRDGESVARPVGIAIGVSVGVPGHHRRRRYMQDIDGSRRREDGGGDTAGVVVVLSCCFTRERRRL